MAQEMEEEVVEVVVAVVARQEVGLALSWVSWVVRVGRAAIVKGV